VSQPVNQIQGLVGTYDRNYGDLEGDAKRAKALEDTIGYLGYEEFVRIHNCLLEATDKTGLTPSWGEFRLGLMMVGVQGYPAIAWYELAYGRAAYVECRARPIAKSGPMGHADTSDD
jgi:hypothetical protein